VEDMKQFQNDNYAYYAKDLVPFLMENVNDLNLNPGQKEVWDLLKNWDYNYTADSRAATAFEMIYDTLMVLVWDELQPYDEKGLDAPTGYVTVQIMKAHPEHALMDYKDTRPIEDAADMLNMLLASLETELRVIREARTANDQQMLLERVHRLHGATRYCGVPQLRQACERCETLLKQGHADAPAALDELEAAIERLRQHAPQPG